MVLLNIRRKKMKIIIVKFLTFFSVLFTLMILGNGAKITASTMFQENSKAYGFSISEYYEPFTTKEFYVFEKEVYRKKKFEHYTQLVETFLQNTVDNSIYVYAYKIVSEPNQPGRHWGFMGIGSYGDDFLQDSVKTTIQFPESYSILSYAPQNSPVSTTTTIGVSAGTSGFDISSQVSFEHSELEVISNTSTHRRIYETIYEFDSKDNWTSYNAGEVSSFGIVLFRSYDDPSFKVNHYIRYHDWNGGEKSLELVKFETGC